MNLMDYKDRKERDIEKDTNDVEIVVVSDQPIIKEKIYNPSNGEFVRIEEERIDIEALERIKAIRQKQIACIDEILKAVEAITPKEIE